MTSQKELKLAYALAVVLLLVGGICYAAFPVKKPEDPVRKMFKTNAGRVLFTHKLHRTETGYGVSCLDCHHHFEEDGADFRSCGECHPGDAPKVVPQICRDCHEPGEAHHPEVAEEDGYACKDCHQVAEEADLPVACTDCHEADEIEGQEKIMNFQKRSDAFHTQCISCHKQYGKGPVECSHCHVM